MKISLVIPTLRVNNLVDKCVESFSSQYDEVIIIDDTDKSLAEKLNKGMRMATGDFIVVSNDDVEACSGLLRELCYPGVVVSPRIEGGTPKLFHAHMFCIPRELYAQIGGFDESFDGPYYIDTDYWMRLHKAGKDPILSDAVTIYHNHPASTISTLSSRDRDMNRAREWYVSKWGEVFPDQLYS